MELKQVHEWIDLYFEGETTLAQEDALKGYFSQSKIDETVKQYKPYFVVISQEKANRFSGRFPQKKNTNTRLWKRTVAVAASLVIVFFVAQQTFPVAQPTNEEIAYQEFKVNMYLVAEQLNKGKQGVAHIETFNHTTNKFIKK